METIIFLGKSSLIIGLFYCCFQLFLRNETFFKANRWFLLVGIVIAMIFPFVIIKKMIIVSRPIIDYSNLNVVTGLTENSTPTDWWFVALLIYMVGGLFFLVRFLIQLLSVKSVIKNGEIESINGFKIVKTNANTSPFSFFRYIVYNPKLHTKKELITIVAHEKLHVTQKHAIDMLLAQFLCIVQWANPFAWWYKKLVSQNLEYLVDDATTASLKNKKEYQYLLLQQSSSAIESVSFTNTFFNLLIKKRIVMLNKKKSKKQNLLKMGFVLPFLIVALLLVNTKTIAQTKNSETDKTTAEKIELEVTAESTDKELKTISKVAKEQDVKLTFSNKIRNSKDAIISISSSYKGPSGSTGSYSVSGNKPITAFQFYIKKDKAAIIKVIGYMTGVIKQSSEDEIITVEEIIEDEDVDVIVEEVVIVEENVLVEEEIIEEEKSKGNKKPLIIIDEEELDDLEVETVNPNSIASMTILKGKVAIAKYGKKGADGVIEVTTKTNEDINAYHNNTVKEITSSSKNVNFSYDIRIEDRPLYVIDGAVKDASFDLNTINANKIVGMSVLKGKVAIAKYGKKAKNGVIIITTK